MLIKTWTRFLICRGSLNCTPGQICKINHVSCPPQRPKTDESNQVHHTLSGHVFPMSEERPDRRMHELFLGPSPSQASFLWFREEDMGHVITDTPKVRQDRRTDAHCHLSRSIRIAGRKAQETYNGCLKKRMHTSNIQHWCILKHSLWYYYYYFK